MRLIAPLMFFLIGAAAGALVALIFGRRGTGVRLGAMIGLAGGLVGLFLRDALDIDLGEVFTGSVIAVVAGGASASLVANAVVAIVRGSRPS